MSWMRVILFKVGICLQEKIPVQAVLQIASPSYIFHGVGPLDPFRYHVSRSLFKGLP